MGDTGDQPCAAQGSSVIRMRQGTVPRGQAPEGRGFGTGFSHTVEFSRNVAGLLFGDSPAVPASCHRRSGGTVPRAFQDRQRLPTCPVSVLLVEHRLPRRHLHTEAPPCRPDLLGVRTATEQPSDRILLALGDPLSSDADTTGVVPERSSVSKNFPACSLEKVAPGSTACQLGSTGWTPAITTVPAVSPGATAGRERLFRRAGPAPGTGLGGRHRAGAPQVRAPGPAAAPGTGGRRSAGARPARPAPSSARWSRPAGRRAGPRPG
jgi:hypothetical protein